MITRKKTATRRRRTDRPERPASRRKKRLTARDLRTFRDLLLAKRRAILGDMGGLQAELSQADGRDHSGAPDDLADFGSDCHAQEVTAGLLSSERTLLVEIAEALERIDEGTYGICLGTGQPIGKNRLKARPWAKYCIEYARQVERGGTCGPTRSSRESDRFHAATASWDDDVAIDLNAIESEND